MQIGLLDKTTKVTLADGVFKRASNPALAHQVLLASLAGKRRGSRAQKSRSDVVGSTAKIWRQKGTGRARAGSGKDPIRRGGGVTFAASPRTYKQKVNRKMYRGAMCCILSDLLRGERLRVISDIKIADKKTKTVVQFLAKYDALSSSIVVDQLDAGLSLALRNLPHVRVTEAARVTPEFLLRASRIILTVGACKQLEKRLAA